MALGVVYGIWAVPDVALIAALTLLVFDERSHC